MLWTQLEAKAAGAGKLRAQGQNSICSLQLGTTCRNRERSYDGYLSWSGGRGRRAPETPSRRGDKTPRLKQLSQIQQLLQKAARHGSASLQKAARCTLQM